MPDSFRLHLVYLASGISRNWEARGFHRYNHVNISKCLVETPECRLWRFLLPDVGQQPSSSLLVNYNKDDEVHQDHSGSVPVIVGSDDTTDGDAAVVGNLDDAADVVGNRSFETYRDLLLDASREVDEKKYSELERPYRKCCVEHRILRDTAFDVLKELEGANVSYFLSTGTALGSIRHSGTIIPWDTDVDIAIYPQDSTIVKEIFKKQSKHFFHKDSNSKPMYWIHASKNGRPRGGPHIEIFYDKVYTEYPESLLPLQPCKLYGRTVTCPNIKMFDVWFKSGWRRYGSGHYHGKTRCTFHERGQLIEKENC